MERILLEVCVDTVAGLQAAAAGGADRIELCSALSLGGLTPGPGLLQAAQEVALPVMVMIRARPGDFILSEAEIDMACAEIAEVRARGLAGVVIGANRPGGDLDKAALARMVAAAQGLDITLHRSVDLAPDAGVAVRLARDLGIGRILSSGGAARAVDGMDRLGRMVRAGGAAMSIMPGAGITPDNASALVNGLGIREIHASCSRPVPQDPAAVALGFAPRQLRVTSVEDVRALSSALSALA